MSWLVTLANPEITPNLHSPPTIHSPSHRSEGFEENIIHKTISPIGRSVITTTLSLSRSSQNYPRPDLSLSAWLSSDGARQETTRLNLGSRTDRQHNTRTTRIKETEKVAQL